MPRFSDEWLIDRVMFDYVQGGTCACCSFNPGLFLPDGMAGLIRDMSELETDAANAEVAALNALPWPPELRDQVWMERVRLRQTLRKEMAIYRQFWKEHGEGYQAWLLSAKEDQDLAACLRKIFQLSRSELMESFKEKDRYNIHAAFGTLLCTTVEQIANFELTKYPPDGRGENELGFETLLKFRKMQGGFGLPALFELNEDEDEGKYINERSLCIWIDRHRSLGGPKLLDRATKMNRGDEDDSDDEGEGTGADDTDADGSPHPSKSAAGPSFRGDRRIVRLLIARYWADALQKAYKKHLEIS